ncbi:C40 family peptidase [Frateuria aurantia]
MSLSATPVASSPASVPTVATPTLMNPLAALAPAMALAKHSIPAAAAATDSSDDSADDMLAQNDALRRTLVGLALKLRHIPYVRGGHDPSTGFDCSGFVRYVFEHAIGFQLPTNSASQYMEGLKVRRGEMQPGDLVFFRTAGMHGRISHVGIYLDNGLFIHSPSMGKTVEVSNLDQSYWSNHFAGAKRPEAIAHNLGDNG